MAEVTGNGERAHPHVPAPSHGVVQRNNLPVQLSSFVGRTAELARLRELLGQTRLLTLLGPGGCGKTRLALRVAAEVSAEYVGGVVFVDLAPVAGVEGAAAALAHALGLRDEPGRSRVDSIVTRLSGWPALVLLDNCEHLIDASAVLAETLLRSCPQVRVLATSREHLDLAGETGWRVPSLSLPPRASSSPAELGGSEAVQLFTDRARRVRNGFSVDAQNAATVAEICWRLEGLPLAIELAAARTRVLGLSQIAAGLDEAFRLLTGGGRRAVARQRTLRASVDWSHALLTDPEQVLFRRLAPFAGPFDLAAAEAVGAGPGLAGHQILDQLTSLLDKSLVHRVDEEIMVSDSGGTAPGVTRTDDRARFRLLETIRQYAREHLAGVGEEEFVGRRHRDHFLASAESESRRVVGADHDRALTRLAADLDNLRAAFTWSRGHGDVDEALRIATALFPLWRMRGRRMEGCSWLDDALNDPRRATPARRAEALVVRTRLEVNLVDATAPDRVDECVRLARELGDRSLLARALVGGSSYIARGPHRHRVLLTEAMSLAREIGDSDTLIDAQVWFAMMALSSGDPGEARQLLAEVSAVAAGAGHSYAARTTAAHTALALLMQGEAGSARSVAAAVAHEAEAGCDWTTVALALAYLAWAEALTGDLAAAHAACARSLQVAPPAPTGGHETLIRLGCGMAALARGETAAAAAAFGSGWRAIGGTPGFGDFFGGPWAEATLAHGDVDAARTLADEAVARTIDPRLPWQAGWALMARARVALTDGEPRRAEDLAHRALATRKGIGDQAGVPDTLELLAVLTAGQDGFDGAVRLLGAAASIRHAAGCHRFVIHGEPINSAVTTARAALGSAAFDDAYAEGQALSLAEAVAYATRGRGERKRPSHGWDGLTPSERGVAGLLATGLSNKEIAARLFVSPRTVEAHLNHVYAKLGVTSRVQLAQEATRHGDHTPCAGPACQEKPR